MAYLIADSKNVFNETRLHFVYQLLSDSFFVPGVVITGFGLLVYVSNEGAFDGMKYAVMSFINMFKSRPEKKYNSFYEYKERRKTRKVNPGFILYSGLTVLSFAVVFYILLVCTFGYKAQPLVNYYEIYDKIPIEMITEKLGDPTIDFTTTSDDIPTDENNKSGAIVWVDKCKTYEEVEAKWEAGKNVKALVVIYEDGKIISVELDEDYTITDAK